MYRPSADFLPPPSTESVASERGGEGGGTPSAMAARAQRRRDAEKSESLVGFESVGWALASSSSSSEPLEDAEDASAGKTRSVGAFAAATSRSSSSPKSSTNETFFEEDSRFVSDSSPAAEADSDCESSATSSSGPRLSAPSLSPSLPTCSSRLTCRSLFRRIASCAEGDASGGGVMSIAVITKLAETTGRLFFSPPPKNRLFFFFSSSATKSSVVA